MPYIFWGSFSRANLCPRFAFSSSSSDSNISLDTISYRYVSPRTLPRRPIPSQTHFRKPGRTAPRKGLSEISPALKHGDNNEVGCEETQRTWGEALQVASSSTEGISLLMSCVVHTGTLGKKHFLLYSVRRMKRLRPSTRFSSFTTALSVILLLSRSILIQFGLRWLGAGDDKVRLYFFAVLRDADRY